MDGIELSEILTSIYGNLGWWPAESSEEVIIGAILTQNTSWKNVEKAMQNLRKKSLNTLEGIHASTPKDLKECIKPAGFFNVKSQYLKEISGKLIEYGGIEELKKLDDVHLEQFIINIKGVGKETMQDIILYAFHRKKFVIDKYTTRLFQRIGILESNSMENVTRSIEENLKLEEIKNFHGTIVELCKDYCKNKPLCKECPLNKTCKYYENDFTEP